MHIHLRGSVLYSRIHVHTCGAYLHCFLSQCSPLYTTPQLSLSLLGRFSLWTYGIRGTWRKVDRVRQLARRNTRIHIRILFTLHNCNIIVQFKIYYKLCNRQKYIVLLLMRSRPGKFFKQYNSISSASPQKNEHSHAAKGRATFFYRLFDMSSVQAFLRVLLQHSWQGNHYFKCAILSKYYYLRIHWLFLYQLCDDLHTHPLLWTR